MCITEALDRYQFLIKLRGRSACCPPSFLSQKNPSAHSPSSFGGFSVWIGLLSPGTTRRIGQPPLWTAPSLLRDSSLLTFRCPSWETLSSGLFGSSHPVDPSSQRKETPLPVKPCPEKVYAGVCFHCRWCLGNNNCPGRSHRGRSQRPRGLEGPHFSVQNGR